MSQEQLSFFPPIPNPQFQDVMLDLETFGTSPGSVIVSIGAVAFNKDELGPTFYRNIDISDAMRAGFHVQGETLAWWMQQSDGARSALFNNPDPITLKEALNRFSEYLRTLPPRVRVWGNGATFDNVLLSEAYRGCGIRRPWSYKDDVCFRTLNKFVGAVYPERVGTHHNALDDAKTQAIAAQSILKKLENLV